MYMYSQLSFLHDNQPAKTGFIWSNFDNFLRLNISEKSFAQRFDVAQNPSKYNLVILLRFVEYK